MNPGGPRKPSERARKGQYTPGQRNLRNPWFRQQQDGDKAAARHGSDAATSSGKGRLSAQRGEGSSRAQSPAMCPSCGADNGLGSTSCRFCGGILDGGGEGAAGLVAVEEVADVGERGSGAPSPSAEQLDPPDVTALTEPLASPESRRRPASAPSRAASPAMHREVRAASHAWVWRVTALLACLVVAALARWGHSYIEYRRGMETLWDATRRGGDASSPLRAVDFRNLLAPAAVALVLLALSSVILKRTLALLGLLAALLVIGQSARLWVGLGPDWNAAHKMGLSFWLSLSAAVVIASGAAGAATVRQA